MRQPIISPILSRRHWIFDLDGTLTLPVHDFAFIRASLGVPDGSDILGFLESLPVAEAAPLHARLQEIEESLVEKTEAAPGVGELLSRLHAGGARLGVLTRNTRENALRTLSAIGVGRFFREEWIIGRDEAPPKPAPDGIQHLASRWGAEPDDVLMVGDYLYDLETGRAAGVATVHVDPAGLFRWPALADVAVTSLAELVAVLPAGEAWPAFTVPVPA